MSKQVPLDDMKTELGESSYEFYACHRCERIITALEEQRAFDPESNRYGAICPCGSLRYRPYQILWSDLTEVNVIEMAFHLHGDMADGMLISEYRQGMEEAKWSPEKMEKEMMELRHRISAFRGVSSSPAPPTDPPSPTPTGPSE